MNKKFWALLLFLATLLVAPVNLAKSDDGEDQWLPPSWVYGSGYSPYDYPGSVWGGWYDPFSYYGYQGKTYHPYRYYYYHYPGISWYPYSYPYRNYFWYPYGYYV